MHHCRLLELYSWLDALKPVVLAEPPHDHSTSNKEDDTEEDDETPDERLLAFPTLSF